MNVQQKIEKWCRNERFVRYANERISEELVYAPNHRIDPEYEELDEAVTWDNRYIVPMMTYLTYRLQLVKLQKNAKNRNRRIWWIFVHVIMREDYTHIIRKSKFPQNPKRSVRFSGKRTKRSVQKRKARNTQKAETKVL